MAQDGSGILDKVLGQSALRRWARAARNVWAADPRTLRRQRHEARLLKPHIDTLLAQADERLSLPRLESNSFDKPYNADWAWRPEIWRNKLSVPGQSSVESKTMLGNEATLFHDCNASELTLRQLRNTRPDDLAPFGLRLDVFRFDGSFLSLVIDLPPEAVAGLKRSHLIRMDTVAELETPLEIIARLNVRHGPNTEQLVRELPLHDSEVMVEFDLAYSELNEKRVDGGWMDLIFEGPEMNQITLRDVTMARRPRAAI